MLLDLPSRQDFEALQQTLDAVLALLRKPAVAEDEQLMTAKEVGEYTRYDPRTVEKWVTEGDFDSRGQRIYLPARKYSGRLRFKRADVEAFGLGVGVLVPSAAGTPEAAKPAALPKKTKRNTPVASEQALRVA